MGDFGEIVPGIVTQAAMANPVVTFASGMIALAVSLGGILRIMRNNVRSDSLDKAVDAHRKSLEERLKQTEDTLAGLRGRFEAIEQERNGLFRVVTETKAEVTILQNRLTGVEAENERLRRQNDLQAAQIANQQQEAHAAEVKIRTLEQQVRDLRQHAPNGAGDEL